MRVLLVTLGTAGDLVPLIALGKGLRGWGHDVIPLGNGFYRDTVRREALSFVELFSAEEHRKRAAAQPLDAAACGPRGGG